MKGGGAKQSHYWHKFHFKEAKILSLSSLRFIFLPPWFYILKRYRGKEKEEFSLVDIKFVFYAVYFPSSPVLN